MRLGLIPSICKNGDTKFNFDKIKQHMKSGSQKNLDFVFFGESFLQGFDSLTWNFLNDKNIAVSKNDSIILEIKQHAIKEKIGVGFGYFELVDDSIYSSYIIIDKEGKESLNYRRISKGWKKIKKADFHYKEGNEVVFFTDSGIKYLVGLCGDFWAKSSLKKFRKNIKAEDCIIWPVHVDYSIDEWNKEMRYYNKKASKLSNTVLMINNQMSPSTHGGAFIYQKNSTKRIDFDVEEMLIFERTPLNNVLIL